MRRGRRRCAVWALTAVLGTLTCGAASGVTLFYRPDDAKTRTVAGYPVEETREHIILRKASGEVVRIPRDRVIRRVPAVEDKRLAALSPTDARGYLELGRELLAKHEDPEAVQIGRHLLLLAAHLDPDGCYTAAYRLLVARAPSAEEKALLLRHMVCSDPYDPDLREAFRQARAEAVAQEQADLRGLVAGLELLSQGAAAAAVKEFTTIRSTRLRRLGEQYVDSAPGRTHCSACGDTGRVICSRCKGYGAVVCERCRGRGVVATRVRGRRAYVPCPACGSLGERICAACGGEGFQTCGKCGSHALAGARREAIRQTLEHARARLEPERLWWVGEAFEKVPRPGEYSFVNGVDYSRTVYRNGRWQAP